MPQDLGGGGGDRALTPPELTRYSDARLLPLPTPQPLWQSAAAPNVPLATAPGPWERN